MFTFSLAAAFITVFIGMGPIKVLLVYIGSTRNLDKETRRRVARRIVLVAGSVAVGLFILGAIIQSVLHFSIGALNIIGGLILLLMALKSGTSDVAHSHVGSFLLMMKAVSHLRGGILANAVIRISTIHPKACN